MRLSPTDLVRGDLQLPSLPDVFRQFTAKLEDPTAKASDFSEVVSADPGLTLRLLKLVNSAYYSFGETIDDVSHAITLIGLSELREMVMTVSIVDYFKGLPNDLISMRAFWCHSMMTALLAKELEHAAGIKAQQPMFIAGMLHDVGSLLLYNRLPEMSRSVLELQQRENQPRYVLEQRIIGFDHAILGEALLQHWQLPASLGAIVGAHHQPKRSTEYTAEAQLLALADQLERSVEQAHDIEQFLADSVEAKALGINEIGIHTSIETAKGKLNALLAVLRL